MKRLLSTLILIVAVFSCNAARKTLWSDPSVLFVSASYFKVASVEFSDTATVVSVFIDNAVSNFQFVGGTFLVGDDGSHYNIRYCKEFPLESWIDKDKTNGKLLTLVFEPMPKNTKAVDLIEGFDMGAFRFLGIHDRRKPLDIKFFAYDADKLKPLFDNFYRSDTVCIKGVIEGYSRNDGYSGLQMYYTNNLTLEDIPLSIDIDENGMFMRKFVIDYPIRNNLYTDNNRRVVPVFITPGDTLELTVGRDGFIDYRYSSGRPFEMASSLNYSLDPFTLYSYMDRSNDANAMTMEQYAGRIETKMNEAYKVLDYMASRFAYNDMDYMMSKTAYDVHFLVSFLDYTMLRDDFRNHYCPKKFSQT